MHHRPCILVVDDDRLDRAVAVEGLTHAGFDVIEAASGPDALALVASGRRLDALFTDIFLGGGADGWDVAIAFSRALPGRPVIYASGLSTAEPKRVGASLFFPKPYGPENVAAAFQALLPSMVPRPAAPAVSIVSSANRSTPRVNRLTYVSRPTKLAFLPSRDEALLQLARQCSALNAKAGLTGALLVGEGWFAQALEGGHEELYAALARITNDPRHEDIRIYEIATAPARLFSDWSMHVAQIDDLSPVLKAACIDSFVRPSHDSAQTIISALVTSTFSGLTSRAS